VMAVGLGGQGSTAAMYHLTTHAFFKALLFLGAGSVIHAMHHEQDIWKMGALTKKLPVTWWTFLIGTLALCGVPPLSGFYSKDLILGTAYEQHNYALFIVGVFVAVLTTFYMFRLVFVAFLGRAKSEASGHAHESPKVMIYPLIVLAFASLFGGLFGIKEFVGQHFAPSAGKTAEAGGLAGLFAPFAESPVAALSGLFAVMVGFSLAWSIYADAQSDPLPAKLGAFARLMRNKFYFDELYEAIIGMTQEATSIVADFFDRWIIAGLFVRGAHGTTELVGRGLRLMQSGNLQTYALFSAVGIALFLFFALF